MLLASNFFLFEKCKIIKENDFSFINRIQNIDMNDSFIENFPQIVDLLDGNACFLYLVAKNYVNLGL